MGTGHAASKFVRDLRTLSNHKISCISSGEIASAEKFRLNHGLISETIHHYQISCITNIDAIYIATHSNLHFECILMAMNLGVPILCEKPLSLKYNQVEELFDLAGKLNVPLIEGIWTLFLPGINRLKQLKDDQIDTDLCKLEVSFGKKIDLVQGSRLFSKEKSGGALYDLGIYPISAAIFLLGNPILEEVSVNRTKDGLITSFNASLFFKSYGRAEIQSSLLENLPNELILRGDSKIFRIESPFIGNSNIYSQIRGTETVLYSSDELPGIGMWREAKFVESVTQGTELSRLRKFQNLSLVTHRILQEIENS